MKQSIYKSAEAKAEIKRLYAARLSACEIEHEDHYVETFAGSTHVITTGNKTYPPLVVLHGINAGAPMALEAVKGLTKSHRIFAIDTVGQATLSAETRLPLEGSSYGRWIAETMDKMGIKTAPVIGISYGGFLLQKLMGFAPEKIEKGIFVVPGGFVNGPFLESLTKLSFPLIRFLVSKKEKHLLSFMNAFYDVSELPDIAFQKNVLLGVKVDYRRPTLLKNSDVKELAAPVYTIVADTDIFFPGDKTLERCRAAFPNFKGHHILKNTKHIPSREKFLEIEEKIREWLSE